MTYNKSGQGFAASDLFVRNGTHNTNITRRSSAKFFSVSWSPNGKTLLAIRGARTLVSMRPNGTGLRVLTSASGSAHTSIASAVYSPDGTKIAYLQCTGNCGDPMLQGQGSIWVMNANGSGKKRIFNSAERRPAGRPCLLERLLDGREALSTAFSRLLRLDLAVLRCSCRHERLEQPR